MCIANVWMFDSDFALHEKPCISFQFLRQFCSLQTAQQFTLVYLPYYISLKKSRGRERVRKREGGRGGRGRDEGRKGAERDRQTDR